MCFDGFRLIIHVLRLTSHDQFCYSSYLSQSPRHIRRSPYDVTRIDARVPFLEVLAFEHEVRKGSSNVLGALQSQFL